MPIGQLHSVIAGRDDFRLAREGRLIRLHAEVAAARTDGGHYRYARELDVVDVAEAQDVLVVIAVAAVPEVAVMSVRT
jgi:hypothetical protein